MTEEKIEQEAASSAIFAWDDHGQMQYQVTKITAAQAWAAARILELLGDQMFLAQQQQQQQRRLASNRLVIPGPPS